MQEGSFAGIDYLGKRLSAEIGCPVRWLGSGKNVLICAHVVLFSISRLADSSDWSWAKEMHDRATRKEG